MPQQRLVRSETDRMIAGVCGGLAAYLNIDPVLVRLAFVVLLLASGIGLAIYFILWIVMPAESQGQAATMVAGEKMIDDPAALKSRDNTAATAGVLLVLFGAFFLMNQLGWVSSAFWPVVLIGAGLYFIFRRTR